MSKRDPYALSVPVSVPLNDLSLCGPRGAPVNVTRNICCFSWEKWQTFAVTIKGRALEKQHGACFKMFLAIAFLFPSIGFKHVMIAVLLTCLLGVSRGISSVFSENLSFATFATRNSLLKMFHCVCCFHYWDKTDRVIKNIITCSVTRLVWQNFA